MLLVVSSSLRADVVKPALVEISVYTSGKFTIEVRASVEALLTGINGQYRNTKEAPTAEEYDALRVLPAPELQEKFKAFYQRFENSIKLSFDGQPTTLKISKVEIPEPGYTKVPRNSAIYLEGTVNRDAKSLTWYYPAAFGDNAVRVRQVDKAHEKWHWSEWQWLRNDELSESFSLTEVFSKRPLVSVIQEYVMAGFFHILPKGLDHILFILGIFLLSLKLRPLLWQVTMFTIAHTITLALSMTGVISLPARIVEPLIALSIAYIGLENIYHRNLNNSRLVIVFGFGLLHGMGFASMLSDFGMPDEAFATALISFNVGVELGQLALILIGFAAVGFWFRQRDWYRTVIIIPGSALIGLTGLYWTYDRLVF
ncbi:MAG: HupE/UreJ family protein [Chromatiales bacterium]|jgi:hydrogenase/urease accessory protein HupE